MLISSESVRAATDAILEGIVRVGYVVVGLSRHIFQHELYGIYRHFAGDVVHHRFDSEAPLGGQARGSSRETTLLVYTG